LRHQCRLEAASTADAVILDLLTDGAPGEEMRRRILVEVF
jgi:hypothetical protein